MLIAGRIAGSAGSTVIGRCIWNVSTWTSSGAFLQARGHMRVLVSCWPRQCMHGIAAAETSCAKACVGMGACVEERGTSYTNAQTVVRVHCLPSAYLAKAIRKVQGATHAWWQIVPRAEPKNPRSQITEP